MYDEKKLDVKEHSNELSLEELEAVTGGIADLRGAPREQVVEISDNTKSKA